MAFTTKVANILKGAISNSISNSIGGFASGLIANQQQNSKVAAQLLNKSPLEIENINPTSHMKENPYSYGTVYYPFETSNLGEGHYIIFDVIMHNNLTYHHQAQLFLVLCRIRMLTTLS